MEDRLRKDKLVTEFDYGGAVEIPDVRKLNIRFEDIAEIYQKYHPNSDLSLLTRAYIFSAKEHKGQLRQSGEPYLVHPMNVAKILARMKLDETTIAVGFLHDILEDTHISYKVLEEYFGKDIADLADGVTKISRIEYRSFEHKQAENLRKLWLASAKDIRVIFIKIADRLHNMSTLDALPPAKQRRISKETIEIYVPIANRLGMGYIQRELQEYCFKYLYPRQYRALAEKIEKERKISTATISRIETQLSDELKKAGIETTIKGRMKSNYSIFMKMVRQDIPLSEVYDYLAFRIITNSVSDCYTVLGIAHNIWRPIPGRFKDYIAMPKPNDYRSLHTSVLDKEGHVFEIQIRTEWMEIIAQEGLPAHWKYKEGGDARDNAEDIQYINWLRDIVQRQQELENPEEFINALKIDLYPDKVYCFTPQGNIKSFPTDASALDFAYAIHTEVGNECVGAKINSKIVPLKTRLKNGDVVEIITRKGSKPKHDWLHYVKTSRALTKIRQHLNKEERETSIGIGEKMLRKEMAKYNMNIRKTSTKHDLIAVCSDWGYNSIEDIYVALGFGKLSLKQIFNRLIPQAPEEKKQITDVPKAVSLEKTGDLQPKKQTDSIINVKGHSDILVHLARCCNPLPGEPIIGFITRGRGISVHSKSCPNVQKMIFNAERILESKWQVSKGEKFLTRLMIRVENNPGMLAKITNTIAQLDINIHHLEAKSEENTRATVSLVAEVDDIDQLSDIANKIQEIKGVLSVKRVVKEYKESII
jgi:guanosine-3',5'-bis(diphosphate) 3'-pyrophosphohydrolase